MEHGGQSLQWTSEFQPTDAIFVPLTRPWEAEGCDEAGWGGGRVASRGGRVRISRYATRKTLPTVVHNQLDSLWHLAPKKETLQFGL